MIEARNEAEIILHATEKALAREQVEAPGELPPDEHRALEGAVTALREALAGGADYRRIRAFVDVLNQATMPLAERTLNRALATVLEGKRLDEV